MQKSTISLRIDKKKKAALDAIAACYDLDRSEIVNQAIADRIDYEQYKDKKIKLALAAADRGDFAKPSDVKKTFALLRAKTKSKSRQNKSA